MTGNGRGRKHKRQQASESSDPDIDLESSEESENYSQDSEVDCMKDLSGEINTTPEEAMNRLQQLFSTSSPRHVLTHDIPQVTDLTKSEVMKKISELMSEKDVEIKYPNNARKTALMARILAIIFDLCREDIYVTKKDLYYIDAKLFLEQAQSDQVIDDIACLLRCTHESLHIREECIKGRVFGDLVFTQDNCVYNRLAYDGFCTQFPCIVITGEGKPDVGTRRFLKMLKEHLQIPVFALLDCNPHGLQILSTYAFGPSFAIPDIHWLGLRPSDLDIYHIPNEYRSPLTKRDLKVAKGLLKHAYVKQNLDWVRELNIMLRTKQKAEVLALHVYGFKYITGVYLPLKLQNLDWLNQRHMNLIS
nr:DNA topoisomerase 6 subunit A [Tanacetum cinerariifolium]